MYVCMYVCMNALYIKACYIGWIPDLYSDPCWAIMKLLAAYVSSQ
jgi:hypothetical protein